MTLDELMKENSAGLLLEIQKACIRSEQENDLLRKLLWLRHDADHSAGLYGDDGEMQCVECLIDFKHMPAVDIEARWTQQGITKMIVATNAPVAPSRELMLTSLLRQAYSVGGWEINVDHPALAKKILEALKGVA